MGAKADKKSKKDAIYLRLQGKMRERFNAIKSFLALENNTEICRMLINDYHFRNQEKLAPKLRYFLTNPNNVLIADLELDQLIQITLKPNKPPYCPHCKTNNCKHTQFALSTPAIQEHLKQQQRK